MTISQKDNQLSGAQNLGTLTDSRTRKGFVGRKDKIDFFKFALSQASDISLSLGRASASANVKLELRNSTGAVLKRSQKQGKLESIAESGLDAGTYYIGVKRLRGDTKYTLKTAATPIVVDPDDHGGPDDPKPSSRFRDLGILSGTSALTESVGNSSDPGFKKYRYRFELNQISDLNASLSGLSDSVTMTLFYDTNGNNLPDNNETFSSAFGSSSQNATISTTFPKGTYFIDLDYTGRTNPSTAYQLNLTQTSRPGNLPTDPSISSNGAYDLGTLSGTLPTQIDLVGSLDDRDFYKFKVDQIGDFNASINGLSKQVGLSLIYDANGNGLVDSTDPSTVSFGNSSSSGIISTLIAPGTYFLDLNYDEYNSGINNTRYELNLSYTAKPGNLVSDPGSSFNSAYDLGTIPTPSSRTAIDLLGAFDNFDFYKFNVGSANSLTVSLAGAFGFAGNAVFTNVYFDANKDGIGRDDRVGNIFGNVGSFTLNQPQAGDYYVSVDSGLFPNVQYELTLGIG